MGRTRAYRIAVRKRKIEKRKHDIKNFGTAFSRKINHALEGNKEGFLSRGHYRALGKTRKTKTKNAYASYRHKGGYGKACVYSRHDKIQIIAMDYDMKEREII